MISEFLQFGYMGLLAMLAYLCYRIIEQSPTSGRTFAQTIWILVAFSVVSLIGGFAGFLWASKELEISKSKESVATTLKQQMATERETHTKSMLPLQSALDGAVRELNSSALPSTRQEHLKEMQQINAVIQERELQFTKHIETLKGIFNTAQ